MDFKCIYGGSNSGLLEIIIIKKIKSRAAYFPLFIAFVGFSYSSKASAVVRLGPLLCPSVLRMLISGTFFPFVSCSHSLSSPGPYYICLLIACVSIPAVKFNTSLKPSAKPESFREEQAIKVMLAWSSCWLIYWLAYCGWLLVCLTSILFFWRGICMWCLSQNCHFWKQNHIWSGHVAVGHYIKYWYISFRILTDV